MTERRIVIPHLGRVEGHGGINVRFSGETVKEVDMAIHEGSRYYEALLTGKHCNEVQGIISRVCAICSASHSIAALTALEAAMGIEVSQRVFDLRGLLLLGSTIESHALHVFALALPDFLGYDSVISMASEYGETVAFALGLKQLGNEIQELVGGRAVHPINTLIGGFGRFPSKQGLIRVRTRLEESLDQLMETAGLVAKLEVPVFPMNPTIFVALQPYDDGFRFVWFANNPSTLPAGMSLGDTAIYMPRVKTSQLDQATYCSKPYVIYTEPDNFWSPRARPLVRTCRLLFPRDGAKHTNPC